MAEPQIALDGVSKRFAGRGGVSGITATIAPGRITGVVGPDGGGKSTLLRLIDGLLLPDEGTITVCGLDSRRDAARLHDLAGYMPQRFGLYEDLTVRENLDLYADLRGVTGSRRAETYERLLAFTALAPFQGRLAGRLSGGMKQKLGLACALVQTPRVLLLDEPSVGVDPISRRELWRMVHELLDQGIGVVWSTSYLDEAEHCDEVLLLHDGRLLHAGPPHDLTGRMDGHAFLVAGEPTARRRMLAELLRGGDVLDGTVQGRDLRLVMREAAPPAALAGRDDVVVTPVPARFEDAYVAALGGVSTIGDEPPPPAAAGDGGAVIEARGLTKRFGAFTAADNVGFAIRRGEVFGLLGPNGAGKSTTFKMMCGLLRPTAGAAVVEGLDLYRAGAAARRRIGYMAQKFSLYGDLTARQNMEFFAGVYGLAGTRRARAMAGAAERYGLGAILDSPSAPLPLGFKQRLALACAVMHEPAVLFLDEPTSGVDPLTRRRFWLDINAMVERGVTVMVTTHFLDEAEYCDRVALIFQGRVIATGSPDELKDQARDAALEHPTLEDAFIALVERDQHAAAA